MAGVMTDRVRISEERPTFRHQPKCGECESFPGEGARCFVAHHAGKPAYATAQACAKGRVRRDPR